MPGSNEGNEPSGRIQMQGSVALVEMMVLLGLGQQARDEEKLEGRERQPRSMEYNIHK